MKFQLATQQAIKRHMQSVEYRHIGSSTYNVETQTSSDSTEVCIMQAYPRHVVANQYNFPNLIAGNIIVFYFFALDFTTKPKVDDKIVFEGNTWHVKTIIEHRAEGKVLLYKCASSLI